MRCWIFCNPNTRCWSGLIRQNCQLLSPWVNSFIFVKTWGEKTDMLRWVSTNQIRWHFFCQIPGYLSFPPNLWVLVRISCRWWGWVLVFGGVVKGWAGLLVESRVFQREKKNLRWVLQFHGVQPSWWTSRPKCFFLFFKHFAICWRDAEEFGSAGIAGSASWNMYLWYLTCNACVMHVSTPQRYCLVLQ